MEEGARQSQLTRQIQAGIRAALKSGKITQEDLAERLGVSRQAVQRFLTAPCLQTATIERIAFRLKLRVRVEFESAA